MSENFRFSAILVGYKPALCKVLDHHFILVCTTIHSAGFSCVGC